MTDLGSVRKTDRGHELRYERRLPHQPEEVWAALTEPARLRDWLADADVDLREGGRIELRWLNGPAVMEATITHLDRPRLLEYEGEPHGRLRWEIAPDGDGSRLVFIVQTDAPEEQLPLALAGWHIHMDLLENALAEHPTDWDNWPIDRWRELNLAYGGDGKVPAAAESENRA